MSNKRALWKPEDYEQEIEKCNYIIKTTKSWKCKRDFEKRKQRLLKEIRMYNAYRKVE